MKIMEKQHKCCFQDFVISVVVHCTAHVLYCRAQVYLHDWDQGRGLLHSLGGWRQNHPLSPEMPPEDVVAVGLA